MDLLALIKSPEHTEQAIVGLIELLNPYAVNLDFVDVAMIARTITDARYDGMTEANILEIALLNARPHTDKHHQYSVFCARIFNVINVIKDVCYVLNTDVGTTENQMFSLGLRHARRCGLLDERLLDGRFDLERLAAAIVPSRSHSYDLLAISTLYDRYFMHDQGHRMETVQTMIMRVSMGVSVLEEDPTAWAIDFYNLLSLKDYMASTPTLFNAGTKRPQLSSCYLTTVPDDLGGIYDAMKDNALLSKWAGGLGNDWSQVRALNSHIAGTNGKSQGTVPFLKVANDTAVAVNQCFAGNTELYVKGDVAQIKDVRPGNLVLGISGQYREVLDVMEYEQKDPMVAITLVYGSTEPVRVTSGHPFYVLRDGQSEWIDAGEITSTDYIAQVIPTEITVSEEANQSDLVQLGHDIVQRLCRIPEHARHLPLEQTKQLLEGILTADSNTLSLTIKESSIELITSLDPAAVAMLSDIRYQLLRLTTPSQLFELDTLCILTVPLNIVVSDLFGGLIVGNVDYKVIDNHIFVPVKSVEPITHVDTVYDLIVEGDESYMLTSGLAHNGGKRKGACCAYLTTWHLDIEEFVELRKNTGDDRRRTHDMNTANWIPDEFMFRVFNDQTWTLFTPNEVPELNELYGAEFSEQYKYYEENAKTLGLLHKVVNAKDLWRKMLSMVFETGHPWITFKDPCNVRSPQSHVGIVRSSNLCCIAADQRVVTDAGLVTIAELYANQREPVVAGRGHTAQASAMLLPRPNAPMVNIHTKEGYSHKVTPDHRIWVVGKGKVEAQHLVAGDLVELQNTTLYGTYSNALKATDAGRVFGANDQIPEWIWKGTRGVQTAFINAVITRDDYTLNTLQQLQILMANIAIYIAIDNEGDKWNYHLIPGPQATFTHLEELPNEDAYCLTVDSEDHAWTVNGFITHNTEITLNTSADEIAVCNLGSINLPHHIKDGVLDLEHLERTVRLAVRMLDNVIDVNFYPVPQAERSNKRHRPVGLGIMGFQDALYKQRLAYNSDAAVEFADNSMEYISYFAISASVDLATERGAYSTFAGSKWSQGLLPIDTVDTLRATRPAGMMEMNSNTILGTAKWEQLRDRVRGGIRNSNIMAIAPTATISNICTVSQSIEPTFENIYVKSNLSGEFTIINRYLIDELTAIGLWNKETAALIKANDGSIQSLEFIPVEIRQMFLTAFEMNPKYLILSASARQKWIDQAQSLNLYVAQANGKRLDMVYKMAWIHGLKTTYYLRAKGATTTEKSTGATHLNSVSAGGDFTAAAAIPKACAITEPDCEACQ